MHAIKTARKLIKAEPERDAMKALAALVLALESEGSFDLAKLYVMDPKTFDIALEVLREWRIDRYYLGKFKLFDVAWQVGMQSQAA